MAVRCVFGDKILALALISMVAFATFGSAPAAATDISDLPLAAAKRPNPNLVLAIDDSGSTDDEVSFDTSDGAVWWHSGDGRFQGRNPNDGIDFVAKPFGGIGPANYNMTGIEAAPWKKYIYLFPNGYCGGDCDTRSYPDELERHYAVAPTAQFASLRSAAYNRQYYNPAIHYTPWKPYNDASGKCPSGTVAGSGTTFLCRPANANIKAARSHPLYGTSALDVTVNTAMNPTPNFVFRMFAGMVVPAGAKYRLCASKDDKICLPWLAADPTRNRCLINSTLTSCLAQGMPVTGPAINMTVANHADVQIEYYPATYYRVDNTVATPDAYGFDGAKLIKVEIKPATVFPAKAAARDDCAGAACTYAEEIQNFANWFQYYRKRHLSLNAAVGNAFDGVRNLRSGYVRFNDLKDITMYDFDKLTPDVDEHRLLGLVYAIKGFGGTPTRETIDFVGQQFLRKTGGPITDACQFNAQFVITDGFASDGGPTGYGNFDGAAPSSTFPYNKQFTVDGSVITAPYQDKWSDTMADMAMKYYTINLRPDLKAGRVPVNPNDLGPDADKNPNLHLNTYGLILGLHGEVFGVPAFAAQNANPYTSPPNWNTSDPTIAVHSTKAIDELWHATINGRGQMIKADSPEETRNAILDVVNNVVAKGGSGAAVAISNPNPVPGDNFTYASSYNAGAWAGDLNAYLIDVSTGQPSATSLWNPSPQKQLAARNLASNPRIIATYDGAAGKALQWSSLNAAQQAALTNDQTVLDYLRGDRSKEGAKFRSRGPRPPFAATIPDNIAVLGDIVDAEPVFVGAPRTTYLDAGYLDFKAAAVARRKMVYQGANDGMLHAFDALTGAEAWAYVPKLVFPNLANLASKDTFVHKFYVDGTPVFGDVDLSSTAGNNLSAPASPSWRTLLVGALGKGGRGYYALDVTNPSVTAEAQLAAKVMWEFPNIATAAASASNAANMGYSFGKPIIAKTRAAGWVVLVTSGYNNGTETGGDGQGHLFVLNPVNGAVIADLATGVGSAADPSGLAYVSAYVNNADKDNTVEAVYGGDLKGNLWRFDISGPTMASWRIRKLAALVDKAGATQPITTEPELAVVNRYRMVYLGTGQYLGLTDVPGITGANASASGVQTLYGLKDDLSDVPLISPLRASLVEQTITKNLTAGTATLSANKVDLATKKGWFVDLPETGERVVTNSAIVQGVVVFTTNIPDGSDPCLPGGRSWAYGLDYTTGGYIANPADPSIPVARFLGDTLASRVVLIKLASGRVVAMVRQSDATTTVVNVPIPKTSAAGKRKSWREIVVH